MKQYIKKIIAGILWWSGAGPLFRLFCEPRILIVAYHIIATEEEMRQNALIPYAHISIAVQIFQRQVRYLKKRGYSFVFFSDIKSTHAKHPDKKIAALYFDDGSRAVLTTVYPLLKKEHIPATLFLTTDYIDQKKNEGVYLSWEEAQSINDVFEFGSHAVTHRKLNKISPEEAEFEMKQSRKIIAEKLCTNVTAFSYPKGRSSSELENIAHQVGYTITTADIFFHKVRPDPGENLSVFKCKIANIWS